jgi:hypothetical protein
VPVPYGRTVPLAAAGVRGAGCAALARLVPHWEEKRRDVVAAALLSNCAVARRMRLLRTLRTFMPLHVYGACHKWHGKGRFAYVSLHTRCCILRDGWSSAHPFHLYMYNVDYTHYFTFFTFILLLFHIVIILVWCQGQNKRIAPLSFFNGCRKRRLKD